MRALLLFQLSSGVKPAGSHFAAFATLSNSTSCQSNRGFGRLKRFDKNGNFSSHHTRSKTPLYRAWILRMAFLFGKIFNVPKFAVLVGTLLVATLVAPTLNRQLVLHAAPVPVGKADVGKAFWQAQMCQYCHGVQAEGAWGPDLGGRGLSEA